MSKSERLLCTYGSARAVHLAVVFSIEVDDLDSSASVVLDDLIRSMVSSSTNDSSHITGAILFLGDY